MSRVTPPPQSDNEGRQPYLVLSHQDEVSYLLEYLPDGRRVVTGSWQGTVRVWNLESGEPEGTSTKYEGRVSDLAITRDGTKIISCGGLGRIKVWDVESHKLVKEWTHLEHYSKIAISRDDRLVAVGMTNVDIYSMEGRHIHSIKIGNYTFSACFSPDGNKLACGTGKSTFVYDVNSGRCIPGPLTRGGGQVVLWSRDGRLFSVSFSTIRCWNPDTGQEIGDPLIHHSHYINSLSLSPGGSILASASSDKTVRFWNATTGDPIGQHLQHDQEVEAVRFSPSGESVASAGGDGKIWFWRVPWLNYVESRVSTPVKCTSVFTFITLHLTDKPC